MLRLYRPSPRYSDEERDVQRNLWTRLWALAPLEGIVMEDLTHTGAPDAVGFLITVSMAPSQWDDLAQPGGPDLVQGYVEALESGAYPPLDEEAVGRANAGEGIDKMFVWFGYRTDESSATVSLRSRVVASFNDLYDGNRIHRVTLETDDPEVIHRFEGYGYSIVREQRGLTVLSMSHEVALKGTEMASQRLFSYDPPVLGFSAAQRHILLLARQGFTDQEIAAALGKSADSIKKRWSSIYARFAQVFPGRLPSAGDGSRGMEKRRTLLAYLRDRPEELRPYVDP